MGLESLTKEAEFKKIAAESDVKKNLDTLISKQAYEDITSKFKELGPLILGISIVQRMSETTILAAAKLAIPDKSIMIPIVYSNGKIDSTTFIYNEDTDILLGMTKKIVEIITTDSGSIDGAAVSQGGLDGGSIHQLFVPPRNFSSKVANSGMLLRMMETSDLLKKAVHEKANRDWEFRKELVSQYGDEILKLARDGDINIKRKESLIDKSSPAILWSRKDIFDSDWIEKEAAIKEYSISGYAISEGKDTPSLSLVPIQTVKEKIMSKIDSNEVESFTSSSVGAFVLYDQEGNEIEVFSGQKTPLGYGKINGTDYISCSKRLSIDIDIAYAATKLSLSNTKDLSKFSLSLFKKGKKNPRGFTEASNSNSLVIIHNEEVLYSFGDTSLNREDIRESLGSFTIEKTYSNLAIIMEKGCSKKPILIDGIIHTGEDNVKVIKRSAERGDKLYPLRMASLNKTASENEVVSVSFDGAEFLYKQSMYSKQGVVSELLSEGFDKHSIYGLIKTAEEKGGASLEAINAKIEMLSTMMMNLAGTKASPAPEGLSAMPAQAPQVAPAQQVTPAPEAAQTLAPQSPVEGMSDPMQGMSPEQQPEEEVAGLQENGMNSSVDAETLRLISENIKNSSIMDMGVLASVGASSELGEVILNYRDDIQSGVSATARILLNLMTKKDSIEENIGSAKYKQLTSTLKPLLVKMSDMYADIYYLKLESGV